MNCAFPISIEDGTGSPTSRITVPCGKCLYCEINRKKAWSFRLNVELEHSYNAYFATLTYADNPVSLNKDDPQRFLKRLRRQQDYFYDLRDGNPPTKAYGGLERLKIRYFLAGEYGAKKLRPHYHALLFNVEPEILKKIPSIWKHGDVKVDVLNAKRINYTTGYIVKPNQPHPEGTLAPFSLMSRRKPIGHQYIKTHGEYHRRTKNFFVISHGYRMALPRYYRLKMFTDEERAAHALDTEKRAIDNHIKIHEKVKHTRSYTERISAYNQHIVNAEKHKQQKQSI